MDPPSNLEKNVSMSSSSYKNKDSSANPPFTQIILNIQHLAFFYDAKAYKKGKDVHNGMSSHHLFF